MKLVIICPLFHGSGSGSATYYRLLAEEFIKKGVLVTIISDYEQGDFSGQYISLFPARCGRDRHPLRDRFYYLEQNLTYFQLPRIVHQQVPDVLLVHSSFYNFPGLFNFVMKGIRKKFHGLMVADVRDQLLPKKKIPLLNIYDKIIACSLNVCSHLRNNGADKEKVVHIPVLQEDLKIDKKNTEQILRHFGLAEQGYIFYAGLIKEAKGIDVLLKAYINYLQSSGLKLVLAGHNKCIRSETLRLLHHPNVLYVGNQDRNTVLVLMSKASVCVNFSLSEGMPRASLEAISIGCPVVLPRGIPEFDHYCPEFVIKYERPEMVAEQISKIIAHKVKANYPIEIHSPENVIPKYQELFSYNVPQK